MTGTAEQTVRRRIRIFDTTLRDGEQSPGATMTVTEKLEMADALVELGVDIIEAGFPPRRPAISRRSADLGAGQGRQWSPGWPGPSENDIERAAQAVEGGESRGSIRSSRPSDIHLEHKLRMTREEMLDRVADMVAFAKTFTSDVEFSAEDATRSDWDFLVQVFATRDQGGRDDAQRARHGRLHDSGRIRQLMEHLQERVEGIDDVIISVHCHNDLGMATANTLAAVAAGARQVEVTVNGIGERAGNTALEEVVMALATRGDQFGDVYTNIQKDRIVPTSRLAERHHRAAGPGQQSDRRRQRVRA